MFHPYFLFPPKFIFTRGLATLFFSSVCFFILKLVKLIPEGPLPTLISLNSVFRNWRTNFWEFEHPLHVFLILFCRRRFHRVRNTPLFFIFSISAGFSGQFEHKEIFLGGADRHLEAILLPFHEFLKFYFVSTSIFKIFIAFKQFSHSHTPVSSPSTVFDLWILHLHLLLLFQIVSKFW